MSPHASATLAKCSRSLWQKPNFFALAPRFVNQGQGRVKVLPAASGEDALIRLADVVEHGFPGNRRVAAADDVRLQLIPRHRAFDDSILRSIALALFVLLFATIMGLAAKWLIPRTNAGVFRALGDSLEMRAASKRQYVAYRHLKSCFVEHRMHEGVAFALLRLRFSAEYKRARKWYEPRVLKPVSVGEGEELYRVLQILKKKGIDVIYSESARRNP